MAHAELKRESAIPRESRALDSRGRGLEHKYSSARGREGSSSHTSGYFLEASHLDSQAQVLTLDAPFKFLVSRTVRQ